LIVEKVKGYAVKRLILASICNAVTTTSPIKLQSRSENLQCACNVQYTERLARGF